ncbi:alpha-related fimbriae usher protein [Yersinia enterocolitica]|nr:alpha-related fimbriae usher protein [Yersinia enterocolitica]
MKKNTSINQIVLFFLLLPTLHSTHAKNITIEHLVPAGFSAIEENNTMKLLGFLDGKTLPGPLFFSEEKQQLSFDKQLYRNNHIDEQSIRTLDEILPQIPYLHCESGCDYILSNYRVILDKINSVITITNNDNRYLIPATTWGLVHNQSFDLRMTAKNYRAMSARGNG